MRNYSSRHWCGRLAAADAARFLAVLERAIQLDWRRITRTVDRRLALQVAHGPDAVLIFGRPDQDIGSAIRTLNQQLSPEFFRRFQADRAFRHCVLRVSAQALLDDDVELTKGLLRRVTDATVGFEALAGLMELHPKSLNRMLSRTGNPSARNLVGILARLASFHGARLIVSSV